MKELSDATVVDAALCACTEKQLNVRQRSAERESGEDILDATDVGAILEDLPVDSQDAEVKMHALREF